MALQIIYLKHFTNVCLILNKKIRSTHDEFSLGSLTTHTTLTTTSSFLDRQYHDSTKTTTWHAGYTRLNSHTTLKHRILQEKRIIGVLEEKACIFFRIAKAWSATWRRDEPTFCQHETAHSALVRPALHDNQHDNHACTLGTFSSFYLPPYPLFPTWYPFEQHHHHHQRISKAKMRNKERTKGWWWSLDASIRLSRGISRNWLTGSAL